MRDEQAWRLIGEATQRAMDEAQRNGESSACVGLGEIVANVRTHRGETRIQVRIDLETTIASAAPSRQEVLEAGSQVLLDELDQAA